MGKVVRLSHNIDLSGGVLASKGMFWGGNALQTVSIVRRTPVNPQQAIGFKGTVDFTSAPVTSEVTLDCILTENCAGASVATSVYNHAETELSLTDESYVLTSCALNFQAGNPATVNYGYITAGEASALLATADPQVLLAGEEAAFAVIMGEDGSGITLIGARSDGSIFVIPPGAQTVSFNASLNRNQVLDIRKSSPVQFVTTYPLDISSTLEVLQSLGKVLPDGTSGASNSAKNLSKLTVEAGASALNNGILSVPLGHAVGLVEENLDGKTQPSDPTKPSAGKASTAKKYVVASGMKLTEETESINTSGNLTFQYSFQVADLQIPLNVPEGNSDSSTSASGSAS